MCIYFILFFLFSGVNVFEMFVFWFYVVAFFLGCEIRLEKNA